MNSENTIIDIIKKELGREEVSRENSFIEDLHTDSLDTVEIIFAIEDELGVNIPDETAETLETVGQLIDYVDNIHAPNKRPPLKLGVS